MKDSLLQGILTFLNSSSNMRVPLADDWPNAERIEKRRQKYEKAIEKKILTNCKIVNKKGKARNRERGDGSLHHLTVHHDCATERYLPLKQRKEKSVRALTHFYLNTLRLSLSFHPINSTNRRSNVNRIEAQVNQLLLDKKKPGSKLFLIRFRRDVPAMLSAGRKRAEETRETQFVQTSQDGSSAREAGFFLAASFRLHEKRSKVESVWLAIAKPIVHQQKPSQCALSASSRVSAEINPGYMVSLLAIRISSCFFDENGTDRGLGTNI
ncbi:hypothetical protein WH47_01195 [Habropoda laboriosa]|uniref:Uncharacterized protein n=1 Tax=Habropoda laboriosa TaxID=597456 RepID=A0A0L7QZ25_9HYME|nr:hypothetical protein WH47_01195 [Habropoda laboriosa]